MTKTPFGITALTVAAAIGVGLFPAWVVEASAGRDCERAPGLAKCVMQIDGEPRVFSASSIAALHILAGKLDHEVRTMSGLNFEDQQAFTQAKSAVLSAAQAYAGGLGMFIGSEREEVSALAKQTFDRVTSMVEVLEDTGEMVALKGFWQAMAEVVMARKDLSKALAEAV